jgi:hypothetical protein
MTKAISSTRVGGLWSDRPVVDYVAMLVIVGAHLLLVLTTGRADLLLWIDDDQRQVLYQAGAGVVAIVGGLGSIALAVYQALEGVRADAVKRLYATELRRNWLAVTSATGTCALACVIAIAIDHPAAEGAPAATGDPYFARFLFEAAIVLSVLRFIRLLWLFHSMLKLDEAESRDKPRPPAPPVAPRWAGAGR